MGIADTYFKIHPREWWGEFIRDNLTFVQRSVLLYLLCMASTSGIVGTAINPLNVYRHMGTSKAMVKATIKKLSIPDAGLYQVKVVLKSKRGTNIAWVRFLNKKSIWGKEKTQP